MGRKKDAMKLVEMSPLMAANEETGELALNHAGFNELQDALCLPPGGPPPPPQLPASATDGDMFGMLMHQGKYVGAWKKAYFILKGSTLFQYESNKVRCRVLCRAVAAMKLTRAASFQPPRCRCDPMPCLASTFAARRLATVPRTCVRPRRRGSRSIRISRRRASTYRTACQRRWPRRPSRRRPPPSTSSSSRRRWACEGAQTANAGWEGEIERGRRRGRGERVGAAAERGLRSRGRLTAIGASDRATATDMPRRRAPVCPGVLLAHQRVHARQAQGDDCTVRGHYE